MIRQRWNGIRLLSRGSVVRGDLWRGAFLGVLSPLSDDANASRFMSCGPHGRSDHRQHGQARRQQNQARMKEEQFIPAIPPGDARLVEPVNEALLESGVGRFRPERSLEKGAHRHFLGVEFLARGTDLPVVAPGLAFRVGQTARRGRGRPEFSFVVDGGVHQMTLIRSERRVPLRPLRKVFMARARMPRRAPRFSPMAASISR